MKLIEMDTMPRMDMRNHPELKNEKPYPVGIADSVVQQFVGTQIFQWWYQGRDARWRPYGDLFFIKKRDEKRES